VAKIFAFSGKKGSGKTSICEFLKDNSLELFGVESNKVMKFSFATPLKMFCHEILGLTHEQLWGTDEQKNTLTRYRWEDLPHYTDIRTSRPIVPVGLMTARQVVQEVGTGIFRKMYGNIWTDALLNDIKYRDISYALIDDTRFPNEVEEVQKVGGSVIRLKRCISHDDKHPSETALDDTNFNPDKFDDVIFNQLLSFDESCEAAMNSVADLLLTEGGRKTNFVLSRYAEHVM